MLFTDSQCERRTARQDAVTDLLGSADLRFWAEHLELKSKPPFAGLSCLAGLLQQLCRLRRIEGCPWVARCVVVALLAPLATRDFTRLLR